MAVQILVYLLGVINTQQAVALVDENDDAYCTAVKIANERILTAAHCIKEEIIAVKCGDSSVPAFVEKVNADYDLAVLSLAMNCSAPTTSIATTEIGVGEHINLVGCPAGECGMVTDGVVGKYTGNGSKRRLMAAVPAWFGNSGGPLLNDKGELVGVTSSGICLNRGLIECFTVFTPTNLIWFFLLRSE